jgi:hypothetical protein
MLKLPIVALMIGAAASLLLSSHVQAQQVQKPKPGLQVVHPSLSYTLTCRAEYPPEFTQNLGIINHGPDAVVRGTKVHWVLQPGVEEGNYTFTKTLSPNQKVVVSGALHVAVSANAPCASINVVK